jgi:NitT/TauT family transport system permease protein
LIAAIHPIPKIAIFPLILIIFGIGEVSIIVVIAISAFFPALVSSMTGVSQLDPIYFEIAHNYGANRWKTFFRILLPGSLPMILSGVRLGLNAGLLITIAVELLSSKAGLGLLIWFSWQTLRVEELYATMIVVSCIGILINYGLKAIFDWLAPWNSEKKQQRSFQI